MRLSSCHLGARLPSLNASVCPHAFIPAAFLFVAILIDGAVASDFSARSSKALTNPPTIQNPFARFAVDDVDHVLVRSHAGWSPVVVSKVTNRLVIASLYTVARSCEYKYAWITLAGGALGYVEFMDASTNRVALVSVNNIDQEFAVYEARGVLDEHGVSHSREFVRLVYDILTAQGKVAWMTPELEEQLFRDPAPQDQPTKIEGSPHEAD
jgi:hypothetical protein